MSEMALQITMMTVNQMRFFEKILKKVCSFKILWYLCNPKTKEAVVVKW